MGLPHRSGGHGRAHRWLVFLVGLRRRCAQDPRRARTWAALAALCAAVLLSGSSCIGTDETNEILEDGVRSLEQQSQSWKAVLADTRDKLIAAGQHTLAVQVDNLIQDAEQSAGIEVRCYTDFLRDRATNDLRGMLAIRTKEPLPSKPTFCLPSPDSIDLNLAPSERRLVRIDGFNLSRAAVKARIESKSSPGTYTDVSDYIDAPSSYLLTLNLTALELDHPGLLGQSIRLAFTLGTDPDSATEHSVTLIPVAPDPVPIYAKVKVQIQGKIHLWDYDWESSDERRDLPIAATVIVRAGTPAKWTFSGCVDSEVSVDVWVQFTLNQDTGVVTAVGNSNYWEGDKCADELQESGSLAFPLTPDVSAPTYSWTSGLDNGDGGVYPSVVFTYADPIKVLPGDPVPLYPGERLHR